MADREDDLLAGVKSTAVLFGDDDLKILAILQIAFLLVLLMIGKQLALSSVFYLGLLVMLGLFVYQQFISRKREPQACLQAFLNNNWVGLTLFVSLVLHYLFVPAV
jgi:4-hydroxybenzoate polyprenyltransferase